MAWKFENSDPGFLNAMQRSIVEVLFDAIVPSDPIRRIPGASDAGAVDFLDLLLGKTKETYFQIPEWRQIYTDGLRVLENYAQEKHGKSIASFSRNEASDFLKKMESEELQVPEDLLEQKPFFVMLWRHCLQGCFCDARWGGNRDSIMWRWYGYLSETEQVSLG